MPYSDLTPIDKIEGIFFKREDLFQPFTDSTLGGGKVRQCLALLQANKDRIHNDFESRVGTFTNVTSPQGLIVARCAAEFGFDTIVGVGTPNLEASLAKNKFLRLASEIADVRKISEPARNNFVSDNALETLRRVENFFPVKFGMSADVVMRPIIEQCANLPDELDYLVVPSGSCVTLAAVAEGVRVFQKRVGQIIGVQIHGIDRTKEIETLTSTKPKLVVDRSYVKKDWTLLRDYRYGSIELDALYEARAFEWVKRNIDFGNHRTLFWIVANANAFRS
jgi:1-aminocyclopropane-1-carboxylate deaminase/D-cysteine desulfhydrase-like pyridoxal-dependent ACC family enzyme